jgi:hypothetical protein
VLYRLVYGFHSVAFDIEFIHAWCDADFMKLNIIPLEDLHFDQHAGYTFSQSVKTLELTSTAAFSSSTPAYCYCI